MFFRLLFIFFLCPLSFLHAAEGILRAVVLVPTIKDLLDKESLFFLEGVHAYQMDIPGGIERLQSHLQPIWEGRRLSIETVQEIKNAIHLFYQKQGCRLVSVVAPSQNVTAGVLQLVVTKSTLGKLEVKNNCWTSSNLLERYIGVKEGEELDSEELRSRLHFINRNPFRQVNLIYQAGTSPNTTDITLFAEERKPYRFYAGIGNTGVQIIQKGQFFGGFTWAKAFGLDHILNTQYTSSADPKKFQAISVQYTALLPWRHVAILYGGYSAFYNQAPNLFLQNHGQSSQVSLRYLVPLKESASFRHSLSAGFDFKRSENTSEFNVFSFKTAKYVNVTQLVGNYTGSYLGDGRVIDFELELFGSPGGWLPDQTDGHFNSLRKGAKNQWLYGRGSLKLDQQLPHSFSLHSSFHFQESLQTLLPSEEMGIGGSGSVRGYGERQFNADRAILASLELQGPLLPLFSLMKRNKKLSEGFQPLIFFDSGYGANHIPLPEEKKQNLLLSVGPGLRYHFSSYLIARFDLGVKLHNQADFEEGRAVFHFSLMTQTDL